MRRDRTKRKKNKIRGKSREQKTNPPVATILAIDDEPSFLEFYESMLTARGYLVVCSRTVKDAISRLQANSDIALILCDINMGEQSGFELLSYIENNLRFSHIPVVMCTSSARLPDVVQCLKMGAQDYITKPISSKTLLSKVEAALASKVGQLLLVTNNRYEADLISRALRPHAYKVTSVSSRQEAVALLDKEKFSTAVVRLTLPDASGLDVMTEVKERNPNLPVLIIRSGESGIVDEELIAAGADGIIQRPFNNAEIALQINSARQRVHRFTPTILSAIRRAADSE